MNSIHLISLATAILGLLFIGLSIYVIKLRYHYKQAYTPSERLLLRAQRAHANFAEYTPMGLLLLWAVALCKGPFWLCLLLATLLIIGRVIHLFGLLKLEGKEKPSFKGRRFGMYCTFSALGLSCIYILYFSVMLLYLKI